MKALLRTQKEYVAQMKAWGLVPKSATELKQTRYLTGHERWGGRRTKAAKYARVSNKSFYNWMDSDVEFQGKTEALDRQFRQERLESVPFV